MPFRIAAPILSLLLLLSGYAQAQQPGSDATILKTQRGRNATIEIRSNVLDSSDKWKSFLEKNKKYDVLLPKKTPKGIYTVEVQFVVDKQGDLSDVKALTNHGWGMEEEAMRLFKKSPRWEPASQTEHTAKIYYGKASVIFTVTGKKKK